MVVVELGGWLVGFKVKWGMFREVIKDGGKMMVMEWREFKGGDVWVFGI